MAFTTDIQTDHLNFEGGVTVTLLPKRNQPLAPLTIRNATSSPLSYKQIMALSGVRLNGSEKSWNLGAIDVGPGGVVQGDVIDDGTSKWSVLSATLSTLRRRWRAVCVMQPQ